ncbi:MAG: ECF RNA polymerase sigma factor SigW [Verrucomicrobia subdivision 3 bacterium]|nr:ECF RNA polymerase sigma factor SigW [Limisphaerales bacterium]MCS1417672.1 ECF RNA polymerase sigma factor SigW [Limisphaerales bacterium]
MNDQSIANGEWWHWVVARYQGPLIRTAYRVTGNLEVAREVAQDTFMRLCRQDRQLVNGHLSSWLFTVCRNRALDVCKKERRLQPVGGEELWFPDSRQKSPAENAARQESLDQVQEMIRELAPREQEVVRLKFECGMSYREIGDALELSESNVGFILHTAIRKVRKRIRAIGFAVDEPKGF